VIAVADSGALYALYDADDRHHEGVRRVLSAERGLRLVVPVAILAEVDYLLREFLGIEAELDFLDSLVRGAFLLEPLAPGDLERCVEVLSRFRDLDLGLADAAVMVTADRLGTESILTVDERDFRAVVSRHGGPYRLLPADLGG
jgi:predicted nucleic acid-binding protein